MARGGSGMIQTELAIVGAGPAGLSAAIEARRAGADVLSVSYTHLVSVLNLS